MLFALTAMYGTTHGLVEGAERALVAELAAEGRKGTALGAYNMAMGLSALAASTAFGAVLGPLRQRGGLRGIGRVRADRGRGAARCSCPDGSHGRSAPRSDRDLSRVAA